MKYFLLILTVFSILPAFAQEGRVRAGGDVGMGMAQVTVSGAKRIEQPGTFAFLIDYALSSQITVGVEHYRTIVDDNGPSSGVGFTGIMGKYYFYTPRAQILPSDEYFVEDEIIIKGLSPYIGASMGIGQASLRSLDESQAQNRALSVGAFLGGKAGLEYPLWRRLTIFTEGSVAMTVVGTGTILFPRGSVGLLYSF